MRPCFATFPLAENENRNEPPHVDGGYVSNLGSGVGGGTLFSAGGGLRARIRKVELGFEIAAPVNAQRFDAGNKAPRVNFVAGVQF